jgi:radical SAM protein with 4Fe4S-binding SPASM domain
MPIATYFNKVLRLIEPPRSEKVKRVNFAVTYLCDSRCRMCNIWKIYRENPKALTDELSFEEIQQLFEESSYLRKLDEISLTGGEPFIRKDFVDIYTYLREKYTYATIIITTNGLNSSHIVNTVKQMCERGDTSLLVFMFSLDGGKETYTQIRGIPRGYEKVLKTIEGIRFFVPEVRMGLSYTILPENYRDLEEVYLLSRKLGIGFTMRFTDTNENYYGNEGQVFQWTDEILRETQAMIQKIIHDLLAERSLVRKLFNPDTYFFSRLVDYQKNPRRIFECYSGTHSLFLDPYGNIYPCIKYATPYGNIKATGLQQVWTSPQAEKIRVAIANHECHCWTECETIPSLQRTIDRPRIEFLARRIVKRQHVEEDM